jgi:BirA family biotin operon repressor/biotin-[acetyl-CoA-carboxylase] ligase
VLLRPSGPVALPQLSLVAGLAVATSLEATTGLSARVKWPNDVLLDDRKVAGLLLEASGDTVALGIGINVNQGPHDLPAGTRIPATSLLIAAGRRFDRGLVLAAVLDELERLYVDWLANGLAPIAGELERRNALRGRRVRVSGRAGTATGIAADGRLGILLDTGETTLVGSGEVELSPE